MTSGRPDWFGTIVSAGKYDSTFLPIAVDVSGNLLALIKGDFSGALKTIAVDEDGILKANLSVQDLAYQTVRPAYSEAIRSFGNKSITAGDTVSILTVSGQGIIIGGATSWGFGSTGSALILKITTDGTILVSLSGSQLNGRQWYHPGDQPLNLTLYDNDNFDYCASILGGLTFESSFELSAQNPYGYDITVTYHLYHALVP